LRVSGLVDDLSERGAAVAELALQCARADVEDVGYLLLGGLAVLQAPRENRTHPCLHVVPLDARQVTRRDGITQARELGVAAVEHALDACRIESQTVVLGIEAQRRAPQPFEIVDDRGPWSPQLDRQG